MDTLHNIKDILCDYLDKEYQEVKNGGLKREHLEEIEKLTSSIQSIETIIAMKDSGYSYDDGYSYARYDDSYSRGRGSYPMRGGSYRSDPPRYSRDEGKSYMVDSLKNMMENASSEREREALRECMNKIN